MDINTQFRLNAYLAIIFGLSLIIVETIRRYGEWGHWSRWMDDYFMGFFLIFASIQILKNKKFGRLLLIAAWAFNAGLLYGSFFSKITDSAYNFQSNINPEFLIVLIGIAFFTSWFALFWILILERKIH